jgi:FdhE protein
MMASIGHKIACLNDAARRQPEYAGIVPLFIELFRYLETAGAGTGIAFRVSRASRKEKLRGGFPLLAPEELFVDREECCLFLRGVLEVLKRAGHEGHESLERLDAAIESGQIDLQEVFRAILQRKRAVIDAAAEAARIPAPLVEYVLEIPLKTSLEQFADGIGPEECEGWQEGFCPVCGSRAGMAELAGEEGRRWLSCSCCSFRWPFKRMLCPYCGNEDGEKLSYFSAGEGSTRVDLCKACNRYIKTRDSRKGNADVPLDVEDLLTIHLDLLAAREGFERGK